MSPRVESLFALGTMVPVSERISDAYVSEQIRLHADPRGYGQRGRKWAEHVLALVDRFEARSVLDYGCGTGSLGAALRVARERTLRIEEYDPAIPGKDGVVHFADLVTVTDVLEHVEPDKIGAVLRHIRQLSRKAVFVVISLVETAKTLSDGQQAHVLLRSVAWWRSAVQLSGFRIVEEPAIKTEKQWVAVLVPEAVTS